MLASEPLQIAMIPSILVVTPPITETDVSRLDRRAAKAVTKAGKEFR
jgi:hypothetical protein